MISIDEINAEIAKLEAQNQTYQTIEKLAALYTVRDHHVISERPAPAGTAPVKVEASSPFLSLCSGEPVCEIMAVMDELMDTLQVLMPRLYDSVMRKLQE